MIPGKPTEPRRVACVGASITFGRGLVNRREQCYPAVLGRLLGDQYEVQNFGYSGATAGRQTNEPYWRTPSFASATRYAAQIVVLAFGTNDAQHANLGNLPSFRSDYVDLVEHFRALGAGVEVIVCAPPPVFEPLPAIDIETLDGVIRPAIVDIAAQLAIRVLDGHGLFAGRQDLFPDNLHPNAEGARIIAEAVYDAVVAI